MYRKLCFMKNLNHHLITLHLSRVHHLSNDVNGRLHDYCLDDHQTHSYRYRTHCYRYSGDRRIRYYHCLDGPLTNDPDGHRIRYCHFQHYRYSGYHRFQHYRYSGYHRTVHTIQGQVDWSRVGNDTTVRITFCSSFRKRKW